MWVLFSALAVGLVGSPAALGSAAAPSTRPRSRPNGSVETSIVSSVAPSVAPSPPGSPVPPPVFPPPPPIIRRVTTRENRVAITFDACATKTQGYGFDRAVYDVLQHESVPATIFVSGRWVDFHPDEMKELAANPLIELGNHSYDHPHMEKLTPPEMASEIDRTEAALARYGKHGVAFRPPFGSFDDRVLEVAHERHIPTVLWDVVSGDPSALVTTEGMIQHVVARARRGSIVIFHINGRGWNTALALPSIVTQLRARGFELVQLSKLLASAREPPLQANAPPAVPVPGLPPLPALPDDDDVMPPSTEGCPVGEGVSCE